METRGHGRQHLTCTIKSSVKGVKSKFLKVYIFAQMGDKKDSVTNRF